MYVATFIGILLQECSASGWDWEKRQITIGNSNDFPTNNGSPRSVPMNDELVEMLSRRKSERNGCEDLFRRNGLSLFKISSACKIANPNYFCYFELCINQPDRSLDDQIFPLFLSFAIQINISSPTREHLSEKADRNNHSHGHEKTIAAIR